MHYPHRKSAIKRARKLGFRARMRTKKGRQMINRSARRPRRAGGLTRAVVPAPSANGPASAPNRK